jgi:subtilisin family serine protease
MSEEYGSTGRWLVTCRKGREEQAVAALQELTGTPGDCVHRTSIASKAKKSSRTPRRISAFDKLGVAVVDADAGQVAALRALARDPEAPIVSVESESFLEGDVIPSPPPYADDDAFAWGLRAVGADQTERGGANVKVAVLDTGLDFAHPDFVGRVVVHENFVPDSAGNVDPADTGDLHGHGTSVAGVVAGPRNPVPGPDGHGVQKSRRYGIAPDVDLFVGRVLGSPANRADKRGKDEWIIAGIEWALRNGCDVILVAATTRGAVPEDRQAYHAIGRSSLEAGALVVAAGGNRKLRDGRPGEVLWPARAEGIMAVGSLMSDLDLTDFSPRSPGDAPLNAKVDVVAPGSGIWSSSLVSRGVHCGVFSGTSMAAAFIAGVAALRVDRTAATPVVGQALWDDVVAAAMKANLKSQGNRVGAGLPVAP